MNNTQGSWEAFHRSKLAEGNVLEYPDEYVVRFLKRWGKEGHVRKILDVPCGAGRHTALMAELGFEAFGADISQVALELAREQLLKHNLKAQFKFTDLLNLQFEDQTFDAVISWRSLHVLNRDDMRKALAEFKRVIREDGYILFSTRSDRNIYDKNRVGKIVHQPTNLTVAELQDVCADLKLIQIELNEFTSNNRALRDSYWIVSARP